MLTISDIDSYVTCPFNNSHRILKTRIQTHLVKCRKSYPKNTKLSCPYDATHFLDPEEYSHHLSVCPTSGNMKCYTYVLEPKRELGVVSLKESCSLQGSVLDEDWSGGNPSYDPLAATQNRNIIRTAIGLTKSGKKKFKKEERERIAALENNKNNGNSSNSTDTGYGIKSTNSQQPLRAPKEAAKAMLLSQNNSLSDLTTKLKQVSIEQNSSLKKTNVLTVSNSSHSTVDTLKTGILHTSSMPNVPSNPKGTSVEEQAKGDYKESCDADTTCLDNVKVKKEPKESCDTDTTCLNNLKVKKEPKESCDTDTTCLDNVKVKKEPKAPKVPKEKGVVAVNSLKKHDNNKGTAIKKDALLQPSNKQNCLETRTANNINSKMAQKLYGPAKKISTGRGFTIAYEYLNESIAETEERKENSGDLASARGYEED